MISNIKKIISVLLISAVLLSSFAACKPYEDIETPDASDTPTESESGSLESVETPPEDPGESGQIGEATLPEEPEIEKPENPSKTLFQKSKEQYSSGNIGCTGLTLLAEYNKGVDFDINSYKDYDNKVYYLFLPCRADLSSVTFTVTHRDGSVSGPYTADFSDDDVSENEKVVGSVSTYAIKVMQSDRPTVMLEIDESYVTLKELKGDASHSTYAYGAMVTTVTDELASEMGWATRYESKDEDASSNCSMKIRGRGNATWGYPKKPYQMVTENPINLLGMEYDTKYVFVANYRDATGMRNALALEMGHMLGIDYTSDYRQVDLFMNGEYLGMYTLAEKVEVGNGRVEIDQENDVLFEYDNYAADEEIFGFQTEYTNASKRGFRVHAPEDETRMATYKEYINEAEKALFGKDSELYAKYFDVESWAKAYILQTYTMNSDAYYGSFYFYYDSTDGKLHACSPWDFDWSMGVSWGSGSYINPEKYDLTSREWMAPMFKHKDFIIAMLDVYYKGGGREVVQQMPEVIDRMAEENRLSALMNDVALEVDYFPDDVTNYDEAVAYMRDIAVRRIDYMETHMKSYAILVKYQIPD